MAGQPILALVSLILLAGAIVLQFFVILSGAVNGVPLNKVFFLQADATSLAGQKFHGSSQVAWTYFSLCPISGGETHSCANPQAAFPFQPRSNFGLSGNAVNQLPKGFRSGDFYYLMSRFAWVFFLIALVFAVLSFFTGLLALCSRIGGFLSGATTCLAVLFQALAAALMTAWTILARNAINKGSSKNQAQIGTYAYGFSWGAFAALFLCMILFCAAGAAGKKKDTSGTESKKSLFSRKRSTRSRDGVKSEYS